MKKYLLFILFLFSFSTLVHAEQYKEGVNYAAIEPQPTETGKNIEVLEFFWYGCPHCYHFEPYISQWNKTKPANVTFIRIPAVFRPSWKVQARAYYALLDMGVIEQVHDKIFDAIHKNHQRLDTEHDMANFLATQGIDKQKFIEAYNSFSVDTQMRKGIKKLTAYKVDGVPAVFVNGKYKLSGQMAGSYENLIKILNYLIKKESKHTSASKR